MAPSSEVDIDDLDHDEALRYAIELSLQDLDHTVSGNETKNAPNSGGASLGQSQVTTPTGLVGLDRRQMEAERLARVAKRSRTTEEDDDVIEIQPPPAKRPLQRAKPTGDLKRVETLQNPLPFAKGVVKKTWAQGYPRLGEDIRIEEVLQKDQLELAVLSSFQWDEEWMMSKVDITKTKLLLVAYAANEAQKQTMRENVPSSIKFCFPPMHGPGAMHSKLQLLKFHDYMRIVIPTGNLVPYDWGETGVLENMVFIVDLPRLANATTHEPTDFSKSLIRFLEFTGIEERMIHSLNNYDFSATKNLGFVYTVPGAHRGVEQETTGYCGLGRVIRQLGLASSDLIEVDSISASLGSLNYTYLDAIYNACQGDDGQRELAARGSKVAKGSGRLDNHFRIYFPTHKTVMRSHGGQNAAGTICLQAKWWKSPTFPTALIRDCVNRRHGLLMHSKLILVRNTKSGPGSKASKAGWAYVGSANLSESAWGRLVREKKSGQLKLNCRNWECGVVLPAGPSSSVSEGAMPPMTVFDGVVPIPMQTPAMSYSSTDKPWFFDGSQ